MQVGVKYCRVRKCSKKTPVDSANSVEPERNFFGVTCTVDAAAVHIKLLLHSQSFIFWVGK